MASEITAHWAVPVGSEAADGYAIGDPYCEGGAFVNLLVRLPM